jgi:Family of unknown function (DUF6505)
VRSAITLTVSCNLSCLTAAGGNWPELPGKYILIALKSPMPEQMADTVASRRTARCGLGMWPSSVRQPDPIAGGPKVKLLRTIRLDASDTFVFEKPAEPGEWAVSGAFAFAHCDPANLTGKARTAFRAGFLGLTSLGRSTLVQIVDADEIDRSAIIEMLATHLVARFGAPDLATARLAAEEETDFAISLCNHTPGVLVAVTRSHENGAIREVFRTLRPRNGAGHASAFEFLEVVGDDDGLVEHFDLESLDKGAGR